MTETTSMITTTVPPTTMPTIAPTHRQTVKYCYISLLCYVNI